jgi:hypothetical protein
VEQSALLLEAMVVREWWAPHLAKVEILAGTMTVRSTEAAHHRVKML